MGLFINVAGDQWTHVFWLLRDADADAHPVGGTEFEVDAESWETLDLDVRREIVRHALPGSDVTLVADADAGDGAAPPVRVDGSAGGAVARPPEVGRGASREAWVDYAYSLGVRVDDDMRREDIIRQVERVERVEE